MTLTLEKNQSIKTLITDIPENHSLPICVLLRCSGMAIMAKFAELERETQSGIIRGAVVLSICFLFYILASSYVRMSKQWK